jgi:hypothetical protein
MIKIVPTKQGAGVTLWGDYNDLDSLYETVHFLAEAALYDAQDFLLSLAYDVRHAFQGNRKLESSNGNTYFGVDIIWPVFLSQLVLLRRNAAYLPTIRNHQANLFRIEAATCEALERLNGKVAAECIEWLERGSSFHKEYFFEFVTYLSSAYLTNAKSLGTRTRQLPGLLRQLHWFSDGYKLFEAQLKEIAQQKGVDPRTLHDLSQWPEFEW